MSKKKIKKKTERYTLQLPPGDYRFEIPPGVTAEMEKELEKLAKDGAPYTNVIKGFHSGHTDYPEMRLHIFERPEALIITVSNKQIGHHGYKHWLKNFLHAMNELNHVYWFRTGNQPKKNIDSILHVYLVIKGRIRYRTQFYTSTPGQSVQFDDGREMWGNAWICVTGPAIRAPDKIPLKGFQGFRYSPKLF